MTGGNRELAQLFEYFNGELFGGRLPSDCRVIFSTRFGGETLGYYRQGPNGREIGVHPRTLRDRSGFTFCATLAHEMVHALLRTHGQAGENGHDWRFARASEIVGLRPFEKLGARPERHVIPGGAFDRAYRALTGSAPWLRRGKP